MNLGDISLGLPAMLTALVLLILLLVGITLYFKMVYLKNKENSDLSSKYEGKSFKSPLIGRTKYPDLDVFKFSNSFFNVGLLASILLVVFGFAYTQYEKEIFIPEDALFIEEDIEVEPPRTAEPPPPPPPPPPPVIEEVPEELLEEEEEVVFQDQSVEEETVVEAPEQVEEAPPPPPPPPPKKETNVNEIFKVVEDMPRFPGCENESDKAAKKACSEKEMLAYIYKNIKYPAIARENGVEGRAVVTFVVEKDGSITDAKILRDPGAGTGEEALRVIENMNKMPQKWIPGKQRGKPVRVQFVLPVTFKLQN